MVMSEEVILSKIFLDSMSLDEPSVGSSRSRVGDCMVPVFLATADHQTWAVQRKSHTACDERSRYGFKRLVHRLALGR
jgi:hypothetical protein